MKDDPGAAPAEWLAYFHARASRSLHGNAVCRTPEWFSIPPFGILWLLQRCCAAARRGGKGPWMTDMVRKTVSLRA